MDFHLGGVVDESGARVVGDDVAYDPSDLTTHGVVIGMTGSGKTGLGIIFLEEALRTGIPALVIDPKGDMTNLMLTFPELAPADFRPWIDEGAAAKDGITPDEAAEGAATLWREGLASWDLDGADIGALRDRCGMTIYTPGSNAGIPLNVVGDLTAPDLDWDDDAETLRDGIQGYVSGLLGLVDIDADPISSRHHILLSNLIEHAWRSGAALDLETLIGWIVNPPIRKLGVFDIDTFFPEKDRTAFAMQLNGLLASPSFATWMDGPPLDIESMLWDDGTPQASIVYLAHLSETERQFMVTAIFSKLITWMRGQPGSSELRALVYMDEVFGFVPPTAQPPSKKPILTMLKQARAFGVGLLLSTQNPVDLDYKAMSNAGTWCIGRLQTERDKARVLEAVSAASGDVDVPAIDKRISGLGKRTFLLHSTREAEPTAFTTRWAMSYLRGPMTREEVASVTDDRPSTPQVAEATTPATDQGANAPTPAPATRPPTPEDVPVGWLHASAPWADLVGFDATGDHYEPVVAVEVEVHFDESRIGFEHTDTFEAIIEVSESLDASAVRPVDHDVRDVTDSGEDLPYAAAVDLDSRWIDGIRRFIVDHLDRTGEITVFRHRQLQLVSRPDEDEAQFAARVSAAAADRADEEMADKQEDFERRIRSARRAYEDAVRDADDAAQAADAEKTDALLGAGLDLLMGRKPKLSRSSRSAESRLRRAESKIERARDAYEDLAQDLDEELADIRDEWAEAGADVESVTVGLERDDIRVRDTRLIWVRR